MARPLRFPFKRLVAFDQQMLDAIEAWRRQQTPIPSEADAVRQLLAKALRLGSDQTK
ncbi:MAG: hypothetical protein ACOH2T_29415 [Pseudomonas sp.]